MKKESTLPVSRFVRATQEPRACRTTSFHRVLSSQTTCPGLPRWTPPRSNPPAMSVDMRIEVTRVMYGTTTQRQRQGISETRCSRRHRLQGRSRLLGSNSKDRRLNFFGCTGRLENMLVVRGEAKRMVQRSGLPATRIPPGLIFVWRGCH